MNGARKLSELRAAANKAARAVRDEEDRQRNAYNDALAELHKEMGELIGRAGWVVSQRSRKHVAIISARPEFGGKEALLRLEFTHAEADTPDIYEDALNTAVCVVWTPTGEMCRFTKPPQLAVLAAVVEAYMVLVPAPYTS